MLLDVLLPLAGSIPLMVTSALLSGAVLFAAALAPMGPPLRLKVLMTGCLFCVVCLFAQIGHTTIDALNEEAACIFDTQPTLFACTTVLLCADALLAALAVRGILRDMAR